jgi:hypothetical protein
VWVVDPLGEPFDPAPGRRRSSRQTSSAPDGRICGVIKPRLVIGEMRGRPRGVARMIPDTFLVAQQTLG